MVELETDATTTPVAANTASPENKFCRLCLEENDLIVNLFEEQMEEDETTRIALSQKLFDLFQIKYEESPSLPNKICKNCLQMVKSFSIFRENVHKIESELQKRIASLKYGGIGIGMEKIIENPSRAGLNGEPGIFVPENGAVIIEVNPDQEYESSDDEFSMDSDSEADEAHNANLVTSATTVASVTGTTNSAPTDSLIASSYNNTLSTDVEMTPVLGPQAEKNSSVLTSSNIVEKSYNMEGAQKVVTYSCQYCDISFSEMSECAEHVSRHDPTGPYVCSFCSQRYLDRQNLINHIRETHDSERPYICAICNKGFMRRTDLRKHSIVHTGVRPYTCMVCGKGFSRNTNLTKHLRIHNSVRPHMCTRCPRSFGTADDLNRHTRTHTIHKPFHCSRCNSSFARRDKLTQHEMTHFRRDSQFLKNQSGNSNNSQMNSNPLNLKDDIQQPQHMESMVVPLNPYAATSEQAQLPQSGEDPYRHSILAAQLQQPLVSGFPKPPLPPQPTAVITPPPKQSHYRHYACEICSQTFTRERDYQRHQALHLDKLFSCKQCGKGFSRREKLARHELEQHAPQYPCNICRIPFIKFSDYELHMKMHELQKSVAITAQAASMLSAGVSLNNFGSNQQHQHQQPQQQHLQTTQQQPPLPPQPPVPTTAAPMLPPPSKDYLGLNQRPSAADMTFFSQMVPTMNLGFYSETRPEDRNGI